MLKKIGFFLFFFLVPSCVFSAGKLFVDFNRVVQENFLGVNAVYHGFSYLPESIEQGMTDELRRIEFDRVEAINLRLARTFYRPDWAMGEGEWLDPDWNSVKMKALYAWLAAMKERNVDVALNMGWWFGRDVIWNRDQHLARYPDDVENYAAWVSESLHQIIELRNFTNVKYIIMFTEPGNQFGDIPNGKKTWDYYKEVLKITHERLLTDKRRHLVKIVGPNTTNSPKWIDKSVKELNDIIDVYSSHNYNFDNYGKWYDLASKINEAVKETGKPFWVDEYGIQDFSRRLSGDYGNVLAQANAAFLNAGSQTSLLWILNDQYYPYPIKHITNGDAFLDGKHSWGLYPWLAESRKPRPAWYAFGLLSRLMGGEGSKVYAAKGDDGLHISAVSMPDQNISILVVNGADTLQSFEAHFSEKIDRDLYRYKYDPEYIPKGKVLIDSDKKIKRVGRKILDKLPGRAFAVYSTISKTAPRRNFEKNIGVVAEVNIAYKKKVTASSSEETKPAGNITDGKRLTYWSSSKAKGSKRDEFVEIDLEKIYNIGQIDIYPAYNIIDSADCFPADFSVSLSDDKMGWNKVIEQKGYKLNKEKAPQSFIVDDAKGRYLRLKISKMERAGSKKNCRVKIGEIKAFASLPD